MRDKLEEKDYKELIGMIDSADYPTNDFWHDKLRIIEKIGKKIDKDMEKREEYIDELLGIQYMEKIIYFWLKDKFDIDNNSEAIKKKLMNLKTTKNKKILKSFVYLKYYLKGKRKNIKKDLIEMIGLEKKIIGDAFSNNIILRLTPFIKALLILLDDYNNLIYYLLLDKTEKISYNQYKLKYKSDGTDVNELEKIDINDFNRNKLNSYLREFEDYLETNKKSKLLKCLFSNDVFKLYIQRDFGMRDIKEQEKTITGVETKILIIEFIDNGKFIFERSFEDKGREIASFLINKLGLDRELEYKDFKEENSLDKIENLVKCLVNDGDSKIKLRRVELKNFKSLNVEGAPEFSLKTKNKNDNLGDSIISLEDKGYKILNKSTYSDVKKIDVLFRYNKKLNWDMSHVVYLYIKEKSGKITLYFSNNYLTRKETNLFFNHLNKKYDIQAILK